METIAQIKEKLAQAAAEEREALFAFYAADLRKGVQTALAAEKKRLAALEKEAARLDGLMAFENKYRAMGETLIAGVDEVGRGPLAGPVVAAAVILPADCRIAGINDSKKLSPAKREELFEIIQQKALYWAWAEVSAEKIDEINILQATFFAMRKAIAQLPELPHRVLVDGNHTIPNLGLPQTALIGGDGKSQSIAAASILAKVIRDRKMCEFDTDWPAYDFKGNKGYGAPAHLAALREFGPCPLHRRSFIKNLIGEETP